MVELRIVRSPMRAPTSGTCGVGAVGHGDPNPRSGVASPGDGDGQPILGEPAGGERGGHRRARVGIDGGGARGLAGRVGDEHQIAGQQPDLEDHEQEHDEEGEDERHLHGGLAPVGEPRARRRLMTPGPGPDRSPR